jgi:hypothetical protein
MKELNFSLPVTELGRLQFLTGEFVGEQVVQMPNDAGTMPFKAHWVGSWEPCDRYIQMSQFAENRAVGARDSVHFLGTYDLRKKHYVLHIYSSWAPEMQVLTGNFEGSALVLVGQPSETLFGFDRHRLTLTPTDLGFEFYCERQELGDWILYFRCGYEATEMSARTRPRPEWPPKGFT